jgi:outer membrane protein assembly factor BamB
MHPDELLFVGTHGHVRAIEKRTGAQVWDVDLPWTSNGLVTLLVEGHVIYAGCRGKLFAIDARNGTILWKDELSGLAYDNMTLATTRSSSGAVAQATTGEEEERKAREDSDGGAAADS